MPWPDADYPADPYPGAVPPGSYVHVDGVAHELPADLDAWLTDRGAAPAAARIPVLAYGSNRCPSKITWLRAELGLGPDPVVVLRARTTDVAAVWAAGLRLRDGQRPAVLAAAPGVTEEHAVWLATPGQVEVLDRCEGRGERFRLARLRTGEVHTDDGALVEAPWVYLGHAPTRRPLLVDGRPVRCGDVAQAVAHHLEGEPAATDGLDADTVAGAPHPDEWPAALWLPDAPGDAPGVIVPVRDPATLLPVLDAHVGPDHERIRMFVPGSGTVCWAYAWRSPGSGLTPLHPDGRDSQTLRAAPVASSVGPQSIREGEDAP